MEDIPPDLDDLRIRILNDSGTSENPTLLHIGRGVRTTSRNFYFVSETCLYYGHPRKMKDSDCVIECSQCE